MPLPVRRAQLVGPLGEVLAQQRDIARPTHAVAHGVQLQGHLPQPEAGEEVVGQRDHLDIEVGVGRAERLDPQLVVLAVAPVLRVLVPERRRHVPRLPWRHRVVLHVGPRNGGRPLGTQRHQLAVAILEDVHLLADDLAGFTDPAEEDAGVLENRRDRQSVAGSLDQSGEAGDRSLPADRFGPEDVVHALRGARCGQWVRARSRSRAHRRLLTGRGQTFLPGS